MKHLACIMDGNRRWAKKRALLSSHGHKQGAQAIKTVISFCLQKSIAYLTLYTFSLENMNRSAEEKNFLFSFLVNEAEKEVSSFIQEGVAIQFIGRRELFPSDVLASCQRIEHATRDGARLRVQVLLFYGARQEIAAAMQKIAQDVRRGIIAPEAIDEALIARSLWTAPAPDPDLIVRTGGVQRLSNFLLYQAAYSELYFIDTLWPDITADDLQAAHDYFYQCRRNFGA